MKNILLDDLGIKYPVIQGGMANIATHELASSVTKAGGLGLIGTGGWTPEIAREEIIKMKEIVGDAPFGVNVMLMNPHAGEIIDIAIELGVAVITTGAGNPGQYIQKIQDAGVKIIPVIPSVALAKRMEKLGVDAVIAEGGESGGHVGELTTMVLVPSVIQAVNIPVIAAGGVATSEQFAAAMALGSHGVQIGTVLLTTDECPVHENYKELILSARDTSTIVTGRLKGVPVRALKNAMTKQYVTLESSDIDMLELEHLTLGSLRSAVNDGNVEKGSFMAGQVSGLINKRLTVKETIESLVDFSNSISYLEEIYERINKNKK